jgi:hypothetical protein
MSEPREPGWYPDPEAPATLQRFHDGTQWTDQSRPTGYVTQPAGPEPVATPAADTTPVFGAAPPPVPEPGEAQRRMSIAVFAVCTAVALALLALILLLLGVL